MRAGEDRLEAGLLLFSAAANLERIADHATNNAEEVVYLKEGVMIRHRDSAPTSTTGRGHAPLRCAFAARRSPAFGRERPPAR